MSSNEIPKILDLINREIAAKRAARSDAVGLMVRKVLEAADPDAEFEYWARTYIENEGQETRRFCVYALAEAFGANRARLKKLLRAKGIVLVND